MPNDESMPGLLRPVLLIGRGGSGTRLLGELARAGGVFLGNEINVSFDSVEWVDDIYPLVTEEFDQPIVAGSSRDLAWRRRLRARAEAILQAGGHDPDRAWGWKLPETLLVLPQILRSFPSAAIVHLVRHPLTSSFRRTHKTSRPEDPIGQLVLPAAYRFLGLDPAEIAGDSSVIHNAATWAYQVGIALAAGARAGSQLILPYETLCAAPDEAAQTLAAFIGQGGAPAAPGPRIDPDRQGGTIPEGPEADRVWSLCGELARGLGYQRHPG